MLIERDHETIAARAAALRAAKRAAGERPLRWDEMDQVLPDHRGSGLSESPRDGPPRRRRGVLRAWLLERLVGERWWSVRDLDEADAPGCHTFLRDETARMARLGLLESRVEYRMHAVGGSGAGRVAAGATRVFRVPAGLEKGADRE